MSLQCALVNSEINCGWYSAVTNNDVASLETRRIQQTSIIEQLRVEVEVWWLRPSADLQLHRRITMLSGHPLLALASSRNTTFHFSDLGVGLIPVAKLGHK